MLVTTLKGAMDRTTILSHLIDGEAIESQILNDPIDLRHEWFYNLVKFKNCTFRSFVRLRGVRCLSSVVFENCDFRGGLDFSDLHVDGSLEITDCIVRGNRLGFVSLDRVQVPGALDVRGSHFYAPLMLTGARIGAGFRGKSESQTSVCKHQNPESPTDQPGADPSNGRAQRVARYYMSQVLEAHSHVIPESLTSKSPAPSQSGHRTTCFSNVLGRGAHIKGSVDLGGALVAGRIDFSNATIEGDFRTVWLPTIVEDLVPFRPVICGDLVLNRTKIEGRLALRGTWIGGSVRMSGASISADVDAEGWHIGEAHLLTVANPMEADRSDAFCTEVLRQIRGAGCSVMGQFRLNGAKIRGRVELSDAELGGLSASVYDRDGRSDLAERAEIGEGLWLQNATVNSDVNLSGARIEGGVFGANVTVRGGVDFRCWGSERGAPKKKCFRTNIERGRFRSDLAYAASIFLPDATIESYLSLSGARLPGGIHLSGTRIGSNLYCEVFSRIDRRGASWRLEVGYCGMPMSPAPKRAKPKGYESTKSIFARGLQLGGSCLFKGADIIGDVDFRNGSCNDFEMVVWDPDGVLEHHQTTISSGGLFLSGAHLRGSLDLSGSDISKGCRADSVLIEGNFRARPYQPKRRSSSAIQAHMGEQDSPASSSDHQLTYSLWFEGARISGYTSLRGIKCDGGIGFDLSTLRGGLYLEAWQTRDRKALCADIGNSVHEEGHHYCVSLFAADIRANVELRGATLRGGIDLSNSVIAGDLRFDAWSDIPREKPLITTIERSKEASGEHDYAIYMTPCTIHGDFRLEGCWVNCPMGVPDVQELSDLRKAAIQAAGVIIGGSIVGGIGSQERHEKEGRTNCLSLDGGIDLHVATIKGNVILDRLYCAAAADDERRYSLRLSSASIGGNLFLRDSCLNSSFVATDLKLSGQLQGNGISVGIGSWKESSKHYILWAEGAHIGGSVDFRQATLRAEGAAMDEPIVALNLQHATIGGDCLLPLTIDALSDLAGRGCRGSSEKVQIEMPMPVLLKRLQVGNRLNVPWTLAKKGVDLSDACANELFVADGGEPPGPSCKDIFEISGASMGSVEFEPAFCDETQTTMIVFLIALLSVLCMNIGYAVVWRSSFWTLTCLVVAGIAFNIACDRARWPERIRSDPFLRFLSAARYSMTGFAKVEQWQRDKGEDARSNRLHLYRRHRQKQSIARSWQILIRPDYWIREMIYVFTGHGVNRHMILLTAFALFSSALLLADDMHLEPRDSIEAPFREDLPLAYDERFQFATSMIVPFVPEPERWKWDPNAEVALGYNSGSWRIKVDTLRAGIRVAGLFVVPFLLASYAHLVRKNS